MSFIVGDFSILLLLLNKADLLQQMRKQSVQKGVLCNEDPASVRKKENRWCKGTGYLSASV